MPTRTTRTRNRIGLPLSATIDASAIVIGKIQAAKPKRGANNNVETLPAQMGLEASTTLDIQAAGADGVTPLPRFKMIANTGNAMRVEGWRFPVVLDLAGVNIPSQSRPIRLNHDRNQGVGHTESVGVVNGQLVAEGVVSRDTKAARDVISSSKNKFPWQASVGMNVTQNEFVREGQTVTVNGKEFAGPLNVARRSTLGEISFLDLGADDNTTARVAAAKKPPAATGDPADGDDADDDDASTADVLARARKEEGRLKAISSIVRAAVAMPGANIGEIERMALEAQEEGVAADRFELALLRATRPRFAIQSRERRPEPKAVEAALCLSGGCTEKNVEKWYGADTVEAARSNHAGSSLSELFHGVIQAAGMHARAGRITDATIRTAFEADRALRASGGGFSTVSLSGVLSNVANKTMLESYQSVPVVSTTICGATDVNDFKQSSRYRMTGVGIFQKVGPDGELKSASLTDETYTSQLDTYGRILTLTRQMIINDDLGAFLQLPRIIGRQSALALEDAVFSLLLSNPGSPAFFSTNNKNYFAGGTTNLSIASLTTAQQMFLDQVDSDGRPILITPAFLLVPSSLAVSAQQLMTETRVVAAGTTDKIVPANNPFAGKWQPLASPYLNNASYTGNSATAWYLIANPADVAFMEIAYLRGQRTPIVESGEADFDVLGMRWRGYFDFGVSLQDKRGAVQSKGAA